MLVWLDGKDAEQGEAKVDFFDAGLQHGVGVFETMRASSGRIFRGLEHALRLVGSAAELGLSNRIDATALAGSVEAALARSGLAEARIRLTVTGGARRMLEGDAEPDPRVAVAVGPPSRHPPEVYEQGIRAQVVTPDRVNRADRFAGHKTLWYWPRLRALREAAAHGCQEALWFDTRAHLCGACVGNAMIVSKGVLKTPRARGDEGDGPAPVLPGITRSAVLSLARGLGIEVSVGEVLPAEMLECDEILLTGTGYGVLPVVAVEARRIGSGAVGPVARQLREAYEGLVRSECAPLP